MESATSARALYDRLCDCSRIATNYLKRLFLNTSVHNDKQHDRLGTERSLLFYAKTNLSTLPEGKFGKKNSQTYPFGLPQNGSSKTFRELI